jgi:hypothetical protein
LRYLGERLAAIEPARGSRRESPNFLQRSGIMSTLSLLRDRLLRPIAWAILVAVAGLSGPASAVHNEGVFELDGNAVDDPAVPGIDWAGVYANPGAGQSFIPDPVNSNTDNNFTGGGSKDERDISKAGITNTFWQNARQGRPGTCLRRAVHRRHRRGDLFRCRPLFEQWRFGDRILVLQADRESQS